LKLENIATSGEKRKIALQDLNFALHTGEILGIAGVEGNGQKELAELIDRANKTPERENLFPGRRYYFLSPKERIKRGLLIFPKIACEEE
jgi:simple sugar transport system ATP-binding protein